MRTSWLVVKHDLGVALRQRSFWFFTLLVPALLLAIIAVIVTPVMLRQCGTAKRVERKDRRK